MIKLIDIWDPWKSINAEDSGEGDVDLKVFVDGSEVAMISLCVEDVRRLAVVAGLLPRPLTIEEKSDLILDHADDEPDHAVLSRD